MSAPTVTAGSSLKVKILSVGLKFMQSFAQLAFRRRQPGDFAIENRLLQEQTRFVGRKEGPAISRPEGQYAPVWRAFVNTKRDRAIHPAGAVVNPLVSSGDSTFRMRSRAALGHVGGGVPTSSRDNLLSAPVQSPSMGAQQANSGLAERRSRPGIPTASVGSGR